MKYIRTEQVPAITREVIDKVTCDLCGAEITLSCNSAEEVQVMHRTGSSYPTGGAGRETSVDMCGKCFDTKLAPWLRQQGAEPRTREWDW